MWTYFITHYGKFGIILVCVLLGIKLLLTLFFQNYERSVVGIIGAIFKWYGVTDTDLAENSLERFSMYMQNLASVLMYLVMALLLFMALIFE